MSATVAIVGRPNVGKSTLFNRLVGKRMALVDESPGLTRDWREGEAHLGPLAFTVLDTAGLEEVARADLEARMRAQTEAAIDSADLVLMVVDGRAGVTPLDEHFADLVRRQQEAKVKKGKAKVPAASAAGSRRWSCLARPSRGPSHGALRHTWLRCDSARPRDL